MTNIDCSLLIILDYYVESCVLASLIIEILILRFFNIDSLVDVATIPLPEAQLVSRLHLSPSVVVPLV